MNQVDNNKLEDKLDKVIEAQIEMKITLVENTIILKEHQRRSLANEESVKILANKFEKKVMPHIAMVEGVIKGIGIISTILGIIVLVIKLAH